MSEDKFVWTDELVKEFAFECNRNRENGSGFLPFGALEDFKQLKHQTIKKDWEILSYRDYEINCIRILSDGEVFSIGDEIESVNRFIGYLGKITAFKIIDNVMAVETDDGLIRLNHVRKSKQPLFTTEAREKHFNLSK